jgi:DNA-binding IclR family transcriptional regulator
MIQVIEKVADIFVYLSKNKTREVPLSEIADTLNMNRATCANIIKTLKEVGFIEQKSYRKGYVLGDKLYAIVGVESDPNRMVALLKPLIDSLCKEVNENVMLSVIKNDKRVNVYSVKASHPIEAKIIYEMKAWQATTAKVIIAQYNATKLNDFLKLAGMPGKDWPEVKTRADLQNALDEIKAEKCFTVINEHFACIAAPVFKNGEAIASIGCYLPDMRLSESIQKNIEEKLTETIRKAEMLLG